MKIHEGSHGRMSHARPKLKQPRSVPKTDSEKVMEIGWTAIRTGVKSKVSQDVKRYEGIRLIQTEVPSLPLLVEINA